MSNPNKKHKKTLIGHLVLIVAIIAPIMTLPQIYNIWVNHLTEGVSVATWSLYVGSAFIWLMYGVQLKDKPLIISSTLWVIFESAVVIGVLLYQ